jgi:hypothetical protein
MIHKLGTALLIFLQFGLLLAPSSGISVVSGTGNGGGSVSSHLELQLDKSSSFSEKSYLASNTINKVSQMQGTGQNSLTETISGNRYTVSNSVEGSGTMSTTLSAQASTDGGAANRKTTLTGDYGLISSSASGQNTMAVMGGFEGEGYLSSDITSQAGVGAATIGSADIMGVNCLDKDMSQYISTNEMAMNLEGLHMTSSGDLGKFGFAAANVRNNGPSEGQTKSSGTIVPGKYGYYDDSSAFVTGGWRWTNNPGIQLYLRNDANLKNEGLTASQASSAILAATATWEGATSQNLFASSITSSSTVSADKLDGKNVHAWKSVSGGALGYSRTYYYPSVYVTGANRKNYWKAAESDVIYNTAYKWTTNAGAAYLNPNPNAPLSTNILDLQTVALHELGHTIGLGDTYLNSVYKYDLSQIMGFYDGPQRTLGAGDKNGVKALYG